ncbi:hypothetical protein FACHB389_08285 [Nostoc calcicola FACHB-389]|nr:hypothetical protein [Nostoc calcicola FACHB-3891]OKH39234.1 hypothetical protein FACHB389_08285 [Nostoc calcicola FACHB-389]
MSIYKNSIKAFIQMLDSQSNLISISDWDELEKLPNKLGEDDEEISEILEEWLKKQSCSELLEVYKQNLTSISAESPINGHKNIGIVNIKSHTPANQPSESSKQLIENSIKTNSPSSDNTKTNQK